MRPARPAVCARDHRSSARGGDPRRPSAGRSAAMTFLAPLALAALLVPVLIYLIHWLFGSRKRVRVPALFLWADLPQASTGRERRRWPPLSVLLLLQIAAAILAALALARPASSSDPPRH